MSLRSLLACLVPACLLLLSVQTFAAGPPDETSPVPPATSSPVQQSRYSPPEPAPAEVHDKLISQVYAVADLVIPVAGTPAAAQARTPNKTQEDRLIQLICSTISPRSWTCNGGPGTIDYFPLTMALVVNHRAEIQEQIIDLLANLRRLQDTEVTVELRFVTVSDECLAKLGLPDADCGSTPGIVRLDDAQLRLLIEAVQNDPRTNVMQAPKLTVFPGQKGTLDLSEKQCFVTGVEMIATAGRPIPQPQTKAVNTGLMVSVLPVVSADNRAVTLQLGVSLTRMDAPQMPVGPMLWSMKSSVEGSTGTGMVVAPPMTVPRFSTRAFETTLKIDDGATALLSGWTQHREVRNLVTLPVLSRVPYIGQLFRTFSFGKEREHLLVLVTPHIVRHKEQEEAKPAPAPVEADTVATTAEESENKQAFESKVVSESKAAAPVITMVHVREKTSLLYVNHHSFRLGYTLDNVGPTGVDKIDVWYTRDTNTWERYEEMVPARGHVTITVASDGRWGFTLIPHSGAGLSQATPKPGDQPQMWVEVDTSPPVISLTAATFTLLGPGRTQQQLRLPYRCEDANLAEHPVTISVGPSADGPWTVLAAGLDAEGTFTSFLETLPHTFFLRVEAKDAAGNVASVVSPQMKADLRIPRIRELKLYPEQ